MISTKEYLELVEDNIKNYREFDKSRYIDLEVIQVWYCKTIQNHKGLFIVKDKSKDLIYPYFIEATYNGNDKELYLDFYLKEFKHIIRVD